MIERWVFLRHRGKKWLGDVLEEASDRFWALPGMNMVKGSYKHGRKAVRRAGRQLSRVSSLSASIRSIQTGGSEDTDLEEGVLPFSHFPEPISTGRARSATLTSPISAFSDVKTPTSPVPADISSEKVDADSNADGNHTTETKARFTSAVRSVMMLQSASLGSGPLGAFAPRRKRTTSSTITDESPITPRRKGTIEIPAIRGSRVASLTPKLKSLETTQDLAAHQALVRHLQFSPNGKFLATSRCVRCKSSIFVLIRVPCSWDKTSVIFEVGVSNSH
jgi:WD repeat-containing protein 26